MEESRELAQYIVVVESEESASLQSSRDEREAHIVILDEQVARMRSLVARREALAEYLRRVAQEVDAAREAIDTAFRQLIVTAEPSTKCCTVMRASVREAGLEQRFESLEAEIIRLRKCLESRIRLLPTSSHCQLPVVNLQHATPHLTFNFDFSLIGVFCLFGSKLNCPHFIHR